MNLEEGCQAADTAVFAKTGQHLTDVQMFILRGALAGQTYEEMAANSHYSPSYIRKFAGPALWSVLSVGLGEPVSKTNFRATLERVMFQQETAVAFPQATAGNLPRSRSLHLSSLPSVSTFFGREQELATFHQWIAQDQCRMILVSGIGGIGKTTVMARFARQYQAEFDRIDLYPLSNTRTPADGLLTLLAGPQATATTEHPHAQLRQLLARLNTERWLLILDEVESVLQGGEFTGQYRQDCYPLSEWLYQLAQADHRSCIAVLGRELPAELVALAGERLPVRHWKLKGLGTADAKLLLQSKGVNPAQSGVDELIQMKRGNPLALQIVATTIQELFAGNVAELVKQSTVIIGDTLLNLLNEQFERLSPLETGVMYWLALERQSLTKLKEHTRFMVSSPSELLKTLQSLKRRSLLEEDCCPKTNDTLFTLQPIVLRYTLTQLMNQTSQDLLQAIQTQSTQALGLLRSHRLFPDDQFLPLRQAHQQLMEQFLMNQLQIHLGDRKTIYQCLNQLLVKLHEKTTQAVGYATTNIVNLQRLSESQRL